MKKKLLVILLMILMIGTSAQSRKYLMHSDANIERLKEQINNDPEIEVSWKKQLERSKEIVAQDRSGAQDIQELSLAYRMTGDERYATAIKRILLDYSSRESWEGSDLLNRNPPWRGGLGTSHTAFYIGLGYDAVYDYLSKDERKEIAEGIVRVGIKPLLEDWLWPSSNIHTFDTMGHNWWSACIYMAGFASLAVREEIPESVEWVEEISASIDEWILYSGSVLQNKPSNFDSNGGSYESINYATYGFSQYLLFRYALNNALPDFDLPEVPMMDKMADFFIQTTYYRSDEPSLSVNFGDSHYKRNGNACVVLLWNLGHQKDRYAWYLNKVNHGDDREGLERDTPLGLILNPSLSDLPEDFEPDLPKSQLFGDMGWTMMRDSWEDDATFMAMKSGFSWNHAHADAGSFVIYHNGKNLILDSGNFSYGHPSYTDYFVLSEAHNVVLWNGKAQEEKDQYFGVSNHGAMHHLIDAGGIKYALADVTGPTARYFARNYRHFLWIGDVILIIDDLESYEPGQFEWLLHYGGESQRRGKDLTIKDGDASLRVRPLFPNTFPDGGLPHDFPENMRLKERMGLTDHAPDIKRPYWSFYQQKMTGKTTFVTAIILENEDNKGKLPVIEQMEEIDLLRVKITQNGKLTEVFINQKADGRIKHRNSINHFNGWETDAFLTVLAYDEGTEGQDSHDLKRLFLGHGSYLRKDGRPVIHALSKFFSVVEFEENSRNVEFDGQNPVKINFHFDDDPGEISINGKKYQTDYDSETRIGSVYFENE